jgi:hypothetical protein
LKRPTHENCGFARRRHRPGSDPRSGPRDRGAGPWHRHGRGPGRRRAYKATGHPLPPETLALAQGCDAILFGAVGDPDCDALERHLRPEQAILGLRKELTLFANLRPAKVFAGLENHSALRPEVAGRSTC